MNTQGIGFNGYFNIDVNASKSKNKVSALHIYGLNQELEPSVELTGFPEINRDKGMSIMWTKDKYRNPSYIRFHVDPVKDVYTIRKLKGLGAVFTYSNQNDHKDYEQKELIEETMKNWNPLTSDAEPENKIGKYTYLF